MLRWWRGRRRWRKVRDQIATYYRYPSDEGQALVEYALVMAVLLLACLVALRALGLDFGSVLNTITSEV